MNHQSCREWQKWQYTPYQNCKGKPLYHSGETARHDRFSFFHFPLLERRTGDYTVTKPLRREKPQALWPLEHSIALSRPRGCHNQKTGERAPTNLEIINRSQRSCKQEKKKSLSFLCTYDSSSHHHPKGEKGRL